MDLTQSIASNSDQLDYQDFLGGPKTATITEVRKGPSPEQPVEIVLDGLDRPWRPAKSVRRVLVAAWTADSSKYIGRSVTLYGDASVKWAGKPVGGIRISHLSGLDKPLTVSLTVTRGKREPFTVQPLKDAPPPTEPTIPDNVRETVERVKGTDSAADYIKWAHDNNAPDHIIEYIKTNLEEN